MVRHEERKQNLLNHMPMWIPKVPRKKLQPSAELKDKLHPLYIETRMHNQVMMTDSDFDPIPGRQIRLYPDRLQGIGPNINEIPDNRLVFPSIVDGRRV